MTALARWVDATLGRRLLVRIWFHGALLVVGVVAMTIALRFALADVDQGFALRHAPFLGETLAARVLAARDPAELAAALRRVEAETPLAATVYTADDHLVAAARAPLAPTREARSGWHANRLVARAADRYVVLGIAPPPSLPVHVLAIGLGALLLGLVFVAAPLTRSIARPLEQLRAQVGRLGAGDLGARTQSTRRDEIGELARAFDAMAAQIQQLRAAERQLLGDVSHELRTPLARMRVVLDLAADPATTERADLQRYVGEVAHDLAELERLVDDIIAGARLDPDGAWAEARPPLRLAPIAAGAPIEAALARFRARFPAVAVAADLAPLAGVTLDADAALVRRLVDNFLDNARRHAGTAAPIELRAARAAAAVRVEVIDRGGAGIPPVDHPRVFTAFYRADASRSRDSGGVGLGLALARRIAVAHGGRVGFSSTPGVETCFWFELPTARRSP